MRANFYGLLARVLSAPMDDETLEMMRSLAGHEDDSALGVAIAAFGKLCLRTPRVKAEEEFTELFYGVGAGGEISPYASLYLTGLVYDKPLAELRADMARLGIASSEDNSEPEDHIASLCEMMHGLLTGALGGEVGSAEAKAFFDKHLAPWAGKMFKDLEGAQAAVLYMPVGTIGRLFMEIEREAYEMAA
ncbi:molecular chaperone TorD family protein [Thalassospiraceae bacterium LMO-JJ14]|nr:molecular chaperone TorD family protein [Thalassospiraceae bacterium LMO-JJ14]